MTLPLIATKFYIPPVRADGIARPHLIEMLLDGIDRPGSAVLLSGPAGFGKTTLLSELGKKLAGTMAWVSLDAADNDPIRFWIYFITACQSIQDKVGGSALALLQTPQPLPNDAIPTLLVNDFSNLGGRLVVVLDDYHTIHNPSIHAALTFLLDYLPDGIHLVCSTRVDPPWPLARLRARNRLTEIRAADLRFTLAEAAEFLNRSIGLNLSQEDVAALEERTEGWAAGLQLAAISMKGRGDIPSFVKAFTGSHIYVAEYLVEEVFRHQPEEIQSFLLQTSILELLNAASCEAVTSRPNGQTTLMSLQRQNLFVIPLDDDGHWFRYHHLFADLLRARLQQTVPVEEIATLHRRASEWHEQAGLIPGAIDHAFAAWDYPRAMQLIEHIALPMILQAYVRTVDGWLQAIPPEYLAQGCRANMAYIWMHLLRGSIVQASPYLERVAALFSSSKAGENPSLQGEWLAIQSKLLTMQGKSTQARDLAIEALQILPGQDTSVRSMLYINLAAAYQQLLDYDQAAETYQLIVRDAQAAGNTALETVGISGQAQMLLQQGKLRSAFKVASDGLSRLEAGGRMTPFGATLYGELGQIHYHWHQIDQAQRYFQRSIRASGISGYSDPEIFYNIVLSRIAQMEGDWDRAVLEMQKANDLARVISPVMIREEIISQQVRVDLAAGRIDAAQELLKQEGFTFDAGFNYPELPPGSTVTHPLGLLYNSALRLLLLQSKNGDRLPELELGIALANIVLAGELQCRHIPISIETLLLRSQMQAALGNTRAELADVAQAVELAEPEGFISVFVEEGQPIAFVLQTLAKRGMLAGTLSAHVRTVLGAFPPAQSQGKNVPIRGGQENIVFPTVSAGDLALIEPLSNRELEVLRLIAAGDSNQTIAEKLVITLSAVKKHTGNIFRKLNVNSRTQAVAHAQRLGYLSRDK